MGHLAAQQGLLAREAHLDHVVVVLQEALQLVPHRLHARAQALVPRLDPPHPLQVLGDDLQGRARPSVWACISSACFEQACSMLGFIDVWPLFGAVCA